MARALPFAAVYSTFVFLLLGLSRGGLWTFGLAAFVFGIIPLADALVSLDRSEPATAGERSWAHDVWLYAWVPAQLLALALVIQDLAMHARTPLEVVGLVLSLGLVTGAGGINIAHELMHRRTKLERGLAEILMSSVSYPHFCIEHVLGHHKNVGTPKDPATAKAGESVYAFLPRTILGGLASAASLEKERVKKLGLRPFGLADRRLRFPLLMLAFFAAAFSLGGLVGVSVFLAQSAIAVTLLEVINYVEHYGLTRTETAPGKFQRIRAEHSWSSAHRVSGWYLFYLNRHADHHAVASKPYHRLEHIEDGPQLPQGYAAMLLVALVPPLWFAIMDKRLSPAIAAQAEA